jgi:carbamoyl-phosphate synthase large subunit
VIVQFGGQTPLKLAAGLEQAGVPLLGTSVDAIDLAEDRGRWGDLLDRIGIACPPYGIAHSSDEARITAERVGFPLLIRPSYVLGGRAMMICYARDQLEGYLANEAVALGLDDPTIDGERHQVLLLDRFLEDAIEIDVDALCDGETVHIGAVMQHVEEAGVHSGDSACVIPAMSIGREAYETICAHTEKLALELGVVGLINIQYAVAGEEIYVIEANPRASRTVPFVSKATGVPLAKVACRLMLGERLADIELPTGGTRHVSVKEAVLPFQRFPGADATLGPEMRSTGEVMGIADDFPTAFGKAQAAAGAALPDGGTVFITVRDHDKSAATHIAATLHDLGFKLIATAGTARAIRRMGIPVEAINKIAEGGDTVRDWIERGDVQLVINTPSGSGARTDGYEIRVAATAQGIPCITTMTGASAAARAISALRMNTTSVRSLQELHGLSAGSAPGSAHGAPV